MMADQPMLPVGGCIAIHLTAHNFLSTVPSVFNVWCRLILDAFFIDGSRTSALELQNSDCLSFMMASLLLNVDDEIWVISHFRRFYSIYIYSCGYSDCWFIIFCLFSNKFIVNTY